MLPFLPVSQVMAMITASYLIGKAQATIVRTCLPAPASAAVSLIASRPNTIILSPLRLVKKGLGWVFGWNPRTPVTLRNVPLFDYRVEELTQTLIVRNAVAQIVTLVIILFITITGGYIL